MLEHEDKMARLSLSKLKVISVPSKKKCLVFNPVKCTTKSNYCTSQVPNCNPCKQKNGNSETTKRSSIDI